MRRRCLVSLLRLDKLSVIVVDAMRLVACGVVAVAEPADQRWLGLPSERLIVCVVAVAVAVVEPVGQRWLELRGQRWLRLPSASRSISIVAHGAEP